MARWVSIKGLLSLVCLFSLEAGKFQRADPHQQNDQHPEEHQSRDGQVQLPPGQPEGQHDPAAEVDDGRADHTQAGPFVGRPLFFYRSICKKEISFYI